MGWKMEEIIKVFGEFDGRILTLLVLLSIEIIALLKRIVATLLNHTSYTEEEMHSQLVDKMTKFVIE